MRVQDVRARHPITVEVSEPVSAAARLMRERNIGSIPALDAKGRLRGMLTDRDIVLRCVAAGRDPAKVEIEQIMSAGAVTAAPGEDVTAALARMKSEQVRRLPVVEGENSSVCSRLPTSPARSASTWRPRRQAAPRPCSRRSPSPPASALSLPSAS